MKILVVSDSHSSSRYLYEVYDTEKPDAICFLGDGLRGFLEFRDFGLPAGADVYVVCGNCDYEYYGEYSDSAVAVIAGRRFFMAHGHTFGVRYGVERICHEAALSKCEYALFGHTHQQTLRVCGNVTALNPGALQNGDYAVITSGEGKPLIELKKLK